MFYTQKKRFFNITYVHSMEYRSMCLLSRRYDLTATSIWKLESMLIRVTWRSRTGTVSRNMEGPLRAAMEYLQDAVKYEYKNNFISVELLTVSVCTLNDVTLDSSSVRITMTETTLQRVWIWRMYQCNVRTIRPTHRYDRYQVRFFNIISEDTIRDSNIFNRHQLVDCDSYWL